LPPFDELPIQFLLLRRWQLPQSREVFATLGDMLFHDFRLASKRRKISAERQIRPRARSVLTASMPQQCSWPIWHSLLPEQGKQGRIILRLFEADVGAVFWNRGLGCNLCREMQSTPIGATNPPVFQL